MIVPWLKGFLDWTKAPLTWTLIALNFFIFAVTSDVDSPKASRDFANVESMLMTGRLYYQFKHPDENKLPLYTANQWMVMGGQGLKDPEFLEKAPTRTFFGDDLAISKWKQQIAQYQDELNDRSSRLFGLQSDKSSPLTWITYQFMHASWMHLIGNMMMLLLFGAALEQAAGGALLIFMYILAGCVGAWTFLMLGHDTMAPMVGASGSLSGVMAFYGAFEKRKRVAFFYFISPVQGYWGFIYLPTLLIFPLCFLSDFASYLGTPDELGAGIAYTAHMGGAVIGALLGWSLRHYRRTLWARWLFQH